MKQMLNIKDDSINNKQLIDIKDSDINNKQLISVKNVSLSGDNEDVKLLKIDNEKEKLINDNPNCPKKDKDKTVDTEFGNTLRDSILQFQIDNQLGSTLNLTRKDDKYYIDLMSKKGESLGQISFTIPTGGGGGASISRVSLDSLNKRMLFYLDDGTIVYCDLSALYRLIDSKQPRISDLDTIRQSSELGRQAKETLNQKGPVWDNKSTVKISDTGTSTRKGTYITVDNVEYKVGVDYEEVQEKLIPGQNITIDDDGRTINAKDTVYGSGKNISIDYDNVINAVDTTYTAGDGIKIDSENNNEISVTEDIRNYEELNNQPSINGFTLLGAMLGSDLKLDVITYMTYRQYLDLPVKERKLYFVCKNSKDLFAENCWRIYLQNKLVGEWEVEGGMITLPKFPMRFPFRFA